jgi:hypothetical protein
MNYSLLSVVQLFYAFTCMASLDGLVESPTGHEMMLLSLLSYLSLILDGKTCLNRPQRLEFFVSHFKKFKDLMCE